MFRICRLGFCSCSKSACQETAGRSYEHGTCLRKVDDLAKRSCGTVARTFTHVSNEVRELFSWMFIQASNSKAICIINDCMGRCADCCSVPGRFSSSPFRMDFQFLFSRYVAILLIAELKYSGESLRYPSLFHWKPVTKVYLKLMKTRDLSVCGDTLI